MNTKALAEVLSTHGKGKEKAGTIEIAEDIAVTLFASLGSETLIISAVKSVQISDDMVLAVGDKEETFVLAAQDIRAVRFGKSPSKRRTGLIG